MNNDWQFFLDPNVRAFIQMHENEDVRDLALKKQPNLDWHYPTILDQIKARQKAKIKIPQWLNYADIIFPSSDTLEQASSAATANFKASLFGGDNFLDLTGGAGIDSWAMLDNFKTATIIEADEQTAAKLEHNFAKLSNKPLNIICDKAENYVQTMTEEVDLALIDPQRRTQQRKGIFILKDCSPNIFEILPHIKAKTVLLKTSPMLDINQAIEELKCVQEVHVIEWQGECKELLFVLKPKESGLYPVPIRASKIDEQGKTIQSFSFTREIEQMTVIEHGKPKNFLYEPGPAFLKAGCYKNLAKTYRMTKLHPHTHLYTSEEFIPGFPGRSFEIINTYPAGAKDFPFTKANLTVRNFPQDTATLKKKLRLKDGGEDYLFACMISDENSENVTHTIVHCQKKHEN